MSKNKIIIDIRHLNLFDAIETVALKSCEQLISNTDVKIHWIVANSEIVRLCKPLCVQNCVFTQVRNKKISA